MRYINLLIDSSNLIDIQCRWGYCVYRLSRSTAFVRPVRYCYHDIS